MFNLKGIFVGLKLLVWISIPFVLLILPANFFDSGESWCFSQVLLNEECPGCGITRGIQHAIHFNFKQAWEFNKLFVIVLPILVFIWIKTLIQLIKQIKK